MRIRKRVLGLVAAGLTLLGANVAVTAVSASPAFASTYVSGSLSCVSGAAVEGVFVNANSGGAR